MLDEINKDFYCSAEVFDNDQCNMMNKLCVGISGNGCCSHYHRKHPTPEQYEEKYGEKYPDDGAVYAQPFEDQTWDIFSYASVKGGFLVPIVCACTPFGKPNNDWRPK